MTVERDPVMDTILIGWVILVWCAFINLFVRWAIYTFRVTTLIRYVRECDRNIPFVFSPAQLAAIKRYMSQVGKLSNADMEKRRQLLISGKSFLHIMVAIWIVAGILVLGMLGMSVAFGFWPLAVGAAIALVFFALFAVVAKFLRKRIVEAFNPR